MCVGQRLGRVEKSGEGREKRGGGIHVSGLPTITASKIEGSAKTVASFSDLPWLQFFDCLQVICSLVEMRLCVPLGRKCLLLHCFWLWEQVVIHCACIYFLFHQI